MPLHIVFFVLNLKVFFFFRNGNNEREQRKGSGCEGDRPEVEPQARPAIGEKRKTLPKNLDLGNLPSRRGKKAKSTSS